MNTDRTLITTVAGSKIYQEYERAFTEATGLPLALSPVECWQLPHHNRRNENPLCSRMAANSRSCAGCLQVQQQLFDSAADAPQTVTCPLGLCDVAVPLRLGGRLIGYLQTGQVFRRKPTAAQFQRMLTLLSGWGVPVDEPALRAEFFATRVLSGRQHEAIVQLLAIFAQHLTMLCNQIVIQQENQEPPVIRRAKDYINEHKHEDLSLGQVARAVNTSTFYFCKLFKRFTGVNFTDYLARVRVERARNLLINPNLRVSEIAFEAGFQSLTHFNRVFKKIGGQSPTEYRTQLARA